MKIEQTHTPEEFSSISKVELHQLWFNQALTYKQIAKMYGVTPKEVKEKRKELGLSYLSSAMLSVAGSQAYRKPKKDKSKKGGK